MNITLPMIVLSGKFLNDIIVRVEWIKVSIAGGLLTLVGVPVFLAILWNLAFLGLDGSETIAGLPVDTLGVALAVVAVVLVAVGFLLARKIGPRRIRDDWPGLNSDGAVGSQRAVPV